MNDERMILIVWHEGDCCQAPNSKDGILREAIIQRLTSSTHHNDTAWVVFTKDAEEEEQEEEAIPVFKLLRPGLNHFTQEKPLFPGSITDPSLCIPFDLNDEDKVPYTINRYLRDYQREGIRFIYKNYIQSTGCILGDDMGLGKTVQVIGFLAAVLHKTGTWEDIEKNRPQFLQSQIPSNKQNNTNNVFLIVAPLSVLYNWKDELDTWGYFRCVVVHGLKKEEELVRVKKGRTEIALTTYETLRLYLDQFNEIDWSAVVVDEAHKIKNPNSQITQAMKELRCKIRIGLTGTILQNNLEELWCVMDWVIPSCLGSLGHFKNKFSDPIEQGQRHSATKRALATGRNTVRALVRKISPWFFRRTKALIKEQLPKKNDRVVYCTLTAFQQSVYQAVLDTEDVTLLLRSSEKCDCQSGRTRRGCCYKANSEGVQMMKLYLSYLAILRKVANHAALLQSTPGTSKKQEKYVSSICATVFQKFPDFVQRCKNEAFEALSDPMYSGKMKVLQKLLKYYLQKKNKVLIFSLSTKLLDVLESYCMAEGLDFSRLDGSTKSKDRVQIVKNFNSSSHINLCLVSTMAGGLGLNFVGANVVVLFDPTWNPANDLQAIDRAYRIGQRRDVTVLRLISLGTVEEVIYLRQVYKQQLQCSVVGKESARRYFEAVQGHDVHKGELFGIKNLFRLQTQGTCLTLRILEREGHIEAGVMTTRTHRCDEKEETKGDGEPGDSLTAGSVPNNEVAKRTRDAAKIPRGVLDFSSGSEMDEEVQGLKRKISNLIADDGNRSGKASTSPDQMSLLQHGFSRLLEWVQEKPELGVENSSSGAEESPFEKDAEDQTCICVTTSAGNDAVCLPKCRTETLDISIGSDRKHGDNGDKISVLKEGDCPVGRGQGLKRRKDQQSAVDGESDEKSSPEIKKAHNLKTAVPKVQRFEDYSYESEDLDLEAKTCLKGDVLERGKPHHNKKRQTLSVRNQARFRYTEDIEIFTSSEDEHTTPTTSTRRRRAGPSKPVLFTTLKSQTSSASKEKNGTIDLVLGDVQEVAYTHSNQRVVGGSKAEELISRAAVRDVFERQMFSQLPANNLLGTQESLPASPPDSHPSTAVIQLQRPNMDHPVIFTKKSIHHRGHTTVIIGETPKAICRQQLEEMAEKFKFSSVHQFAAEILRRNSTQRLAWLQQYYTSMNNPDLADTVTDNFSEPVSAQIPTSSTTTSSPSTKTTAKKSPTENNRRQKNSLRAKKTSKYIQTNPDPRAKPETPQNNVSALQIISSIPQNDALEPPKRQKISQKNVLDPVCDVPGSESGEQEETVCRARGHKRTKRGSVSGSGGYSTGGGLGVDRAGSSGLGSREAAAFLNHTDRDTPSSSDLSHCSSLILSKPTAQGREQETNSTVRKSEGQRLYSQTPSTSSDHSFLTDYIGDTSILDDLLKPKPKTAQQRSTPKIAPISSVPLNTNLVTPLSSKVTIDPDSSSHRQTPHHGNTQVQASKGACKDIWDILNEGNEESINRLTDPKEVQRVCINTKVAARSLPAQRESKSLWKTNEKFLWRK
ncbi:DNA excision repair protein ERCC-6-like 2 isoform X3 [Melanotaenia boesemani]|uniref:DNA excision repair protein ERCC-6-like 2 isoform X3 n=1 Tax=Melanotaenia boesemani TaxID=1250792 RepID=UPI001C03A8E5|nr:DNA excision repair protein ERCC-6-like 2 isoform X3 [Melanotaenia boesemani]